MPKGKSEAQPSSKIAISDGFYTGHSTFWRPPAPPVADLARDDGAVVTIHAGFGKLDESTLERLLHIMG
ncbi:MAG: hypothetical protein AAGU11_23285 [Syntrophobacteraceae bacterium]